MAGISQLHKFVQTVLTWWDEFLNYLEEQVTRGVVE